MKICPLMSMGCNKTPCAGHVCAMFDEESMQCGFRAKLSETVQSKILSGEYDDQASDCTYDDLFPQDYESRIGE